MKNLERKVEFYEKCIKAVNDYFNEDLTLAQASKKNGIGEATLKRFLRKLGIRKG